MKVQGLKGLQKQLKQLGKETQPKVLRSAVRAAFKPVLEAAKAKVPVDSGELQAGIALATAKTKTGVAAGLLISSKTTALKQARVAAAAFGEAQLDGAPGRRWHLTELGTKHSPPQPFLRPAIDENAQTVLAGFIATLKKKIQQALRKGKG